MDFTLRDEKKLEGFKQRYGIVALWKMDFRTKRTVEILARETTTKLWARDHADLPDSMGGSHRDGEKGAFPLFSKF